MFPAIGSDRRSLHLRYSVLGCARYSFTSHILHFSPNLPHCVVTSFPTYLLASTSFPLHFLYISPSSPPHLLLITPSYPPHLLIISSSPFPYLLLISSASPSNLILISTSYPPLLFFISPSYSPYIFLIPTSIPLNFHKILFKYMFSYFSFSYHHLLPVSSSSLSQLFLFSFLYPPDKTPFCSSSPLLPNFDFSLSPCYLIILLSPFPFSSSPLHLLPCISSSAPPSGIPSFSGYISPYIPPLIMIQIQCDVRKSILWLEASSLSIWDWWQCNQLR